MRILVGQGSCGIAAGANEVFAALATALTENGITAGLLGTGCMGACYLEPVVEVINEADEKYTYVKVTPGAAAEIVEKHVKGGTPIRELLIEDEDRKMLDSQTRIALRNCGVIDPEEISEYITGGGFEAAKKCLTQLEPWEVISIIKESGLRGCGGAGFPAWSKWNAAAGVPGKEKYIVCNADEGDPGAFMDRVILESDPYSVLEGMLIGGYAVGAAEGLIYIRAEYPLAIKQFGVALGQARSAGFLGKNLFGTDFCFDIQIISGAGSYVCGEETALIASLDGGRGTPRLKPPFPAERGFRDKPTVINNVETLAYVPWIIINGGDTFAAMGTGRSSGTKVFALSGKTKKGGLVEIPMGMRLREIIFDFCGGIKDERAFKAVQTGGPFGVCVPESLLDTPLTYEDFSAAGATFGSGGLVVMDDTTCMVDIARSFLDFTQKESCGKCSFCRIGTKLMLEILDRIVAGKGRDGDIERLCELSEKIKAGSMCALGQAAPNPVLSTIRYFRNEYEDHIYKKKCPAKSCRALLMFTIDADKCEGCAECLKKCPTEAITGEDKAPHVIDNEKCIGCGRCEAACEFDAVMFE